MASRRYTLFTQAGRDGSNVAASPENLVNCYAEQAPGDARTRLSIRAVPGQKVFAELAAGPPRFATTVDGRIFAASSSSLYQIDSNSSVSLLGVIEDSDMTSISGNNGNVAVASGGRYFVWDGTSLTQPSGGAFTGAGSVAFIDQDTIITEPEGRKFEWTSPADPKTRNALSFATKEARDDKIIRAVADRSYLYLMGETSIEVWRNTGASGAGRYVRLPGGVIDQGLKAYRLVKRFDQGVFFIGDDSVAYIMAGQQPVPVSTPSVHTDLQEATPTSCFYYEARGHKFCVIRFADRPSWVYDITTQLWHRRLSGVGLGTAWDVDEAVQAFGHWHCFTLLGQVDRLASIQTDRGATLRRWVVGKPIYNGGEQFSVSELEFLCRVGQSDIGRDARVMLRVSFDGGKTWSREITESLGDLGDYDARAKFYALGRGEQFTPELSISDPADITVYSDANVRLK